MVQLTSVEYSSFTSGQSTGVLGNTVALTSVMGMGTRRAALAGLVVSGNMKHLLTATGAVSAQHF